MFYMPGTKMLFGDAKKTCDGKLLLPTNMHSMLDELTDICDYSSERCHRIKGEEPVPRLSFRDAIEEMFSIPHPRRVQQDRQNQVLTVLISSGQCSRHDV